MDASDPDTFCETFNMGLEKLMYLTLNSDTYDIERVEWEVNFGSRWFSKTDGTNINAKCR